MRREPAAANAAALALLALFALAQVTNYLEYHANRWYHFEEYQFFEAAREVAATGVPRLTTFPNSTAGLDVFLWSHDFTPYLYALLVRAFDVEIQQMQVVWFAELLALLAVTLLALRRQLPAAAVAPALAMVLFEPAFNPCYLTLKINRWPMIFGLLAFLCFLPAVSAPRRAARLALCGALGLLCGLAALSFVVIGGAVAAGFALALLAELRVRREGARAGLLALGAFAAGALLPMAIFAAYLLSHLDTASLGQVYTTVTRYAGEVVREPGSLRDLSWVAYFYASLVVSPYSVSLVPIGIAALVANTLARDALGAEERRLVRVTASLTLAWLALATAVPTHFRSLRMTWMMPFYVVQIAVALRHRRESGRVFPGLVGFAACVLGAQLLYHGLGKPGGAAGMGAAAAAGLLAGGAAVVALRATSPLARAAREACVRRAAPITAAAAAILVLPTVTGLYSHPLIRGYANEVRENLASLPGAAPEPLVRRLAPAVREVARAELAPGDTVLTNAPMREFFGEDVERWEIFFYRGLFGGASREPADKLFLFAEPRPSMLAQPYEGVGDGSRIDYRGFVYRIDRHVDLEGGVELFVGSPAASDDGAQPILPADHVPRHQVERYLDWRAARGLPVR